ncbi:MAG TPA: 4-hydroxy-3-methylbut-2-enyl diphosphate reductase [Rariglobus sp.]|jgi:4-hydroxy-3-methylbut-2-enyl diphosphate reductase|nr:4-hydroxy-3-methylbut-2-enyl diphosphate reductase [Rariglobus sp.]
MPEISVPPSPSVALLAFNPSSLLAVRRLEGRLDLAFTGADLATAARRLQSAFPAHTKPTSPFGLLEGSVQVLLVQVENTPADTSVEFHSIESLQSGNVPLTPALEAALAGLEPHLIEIPYLHLGENDFIYKFRPEKERNPAIYAQDPVSGALYQSKLCAALKTLARQHERSAADPVTLDFGAVQYVLPSHFGFCLGVKNAIERAYETLAANPGRRVFMLSELIHNPFVNEDLLRRGLRYLQSDKGVPFTIDGHKASGAPEDVLLWDTLTPDDIVIIPAFGATDEDKQLLVRKGLAVYPYDATCMLVEKVWKAARSYGRDGYTVIIHGKHEHEETKATFSNTRRHAHAVIVRDLAETRLLGEIIASEDPRVRVRFYDHFAGRYTPGFDIDRHFERVAVVNQTTLLMNETRAIITELRDLYAKKYGPDLPGQPPRVGGSGRNDTLCYATQVNQDALARALAAPLDAAFIIGGKNSSNTYQLYRLCAEKLGAKAYFIQSESNIRSLGEVEHYVFPGPANHGGHVELHPLWPDDRHSPKRILITGGASCPDGVIQQVITRINGLLSDQGLRAIETVQAELDARIAAEA